MPGWSSPPAWLPAPSRALTATVWEPSGSCVVSLAQPKMGLIRYLLGRTRYPDNEWTRAKDGSPIRPYDMATDTMFEFMGVRVDPLNEAAEGELVKLGTPLLPLSESFDGVAAPALPSGWTATVASGQAVGNAPLRTLLNPGIVARRIAAVGPEMRWRRAQHHEDLAAGGIASRVRGVRARMPGYIWRTSARGAGGRSPERAPPRLTGRVVLD